MILLKSEPIVLIIEDERTFRIALAMALSDEGFRVETASNGAIALDLLKEIEPNAIVLDLHMPVLDGYQFAEAYRARTDDPAPVIVCSTRRPDHRIRSIGAHALLSKPVDLDRLVDVVKKCVNSGRDAPCV
jgi:two-component system chemotaxis response regulator CheY